MESLLKLVSGDISKIAIFLLFFGLVALVFEVFYFRKRRKHEVMAQPSSSSPEPPPPMQRGSRIKRRNLVIIGVILIILVLPASIYGVFQQVSLQKEAQITQPGQVQYACDRIDILRNNVLVEPSSLSVDDAVTLVGYCYQEGPSSPTSINRLRFTVGSPSGTTKAGTYLAFLASDKNTQTRRYFKASYPNVKITQAGTYTLEVSAYDRDTLLTRGPFTKTFRVASASSQPTRASSPTQTQIQTQANKSPVCASLSAIPLTGPAPLTVSLTGSGGDSDGEVVVFEFTFGDGAKQAVNKNVGAQGSVSTSHAYQAGGVYKATLAVRDNSGNLSTTSALCSVQLSVTSASTATPSANLKAQPTKTVTPTPTPITLPQAGISLPMVGFVSAGLLLLTFGLLLAF